MTEPHLLKQKRCNMYHKKISLPHSIQLAFQHNLCVLQVIQSTMDSLYSVFSGSLLKGNGVAPSLRPEISSLHSSALQGWSLLLTVLSPPYIMALTGRYWWATLYKTRLTSSNLKSSQLFYAPLYIIPLTCLNLKCHNYFMFLNCDKKGFYPEDINRD